MIQNRRGKKAKFIKELEEHPFIGSVCKKLAVSRATYYRWREEDASFRADIEQSLQRGRKKLTEFAESKLLENIKIGNQQAIAFWLKHNEKRYRPQAIRLFIEENDRQRIDLQQMQQLLEELIRLRGVDALIEASVPDPAQFKENLRNELKGIQQRQDEL